MADPLMRKKMKSGVVYSGSRSWLGFILRFAVIKKIVALIFYVDMAIFSDNSRGTGLILVAKKSS
jgi:hypothetical protein